MNIEKVTMYRASNGKVFNSEGEAQQEELRIILLKVLDDNTSMGETFFDEVIDDIFKKFFLVVK